MRTVLEHLKAAGFDPDLAATLRGTGDGRCEDVEIEKIRICRPTCAEAQILVEAAGKVSWSDGTLRAYPRYGGWKGSQQYCVTMYFKLDQLPPALKNEKARKMLWQES